MESGGVEVLNGVQGLTAFWPVRWLGMWPVDATDIQPKLVGGALAGLIDLSIDELTEMDGSKTKAR